MSYDSFLNKNFRNEEAIFIWGDSQVFRGLDIETMSNELEKSVYSAAHHGAGVYDFLKFTKMVPRESHVLISISKLVLVRRKNRDYNQTGLSLWGLKVLLQNNYTIKDVFAILSQNLLPKENLTYRSRLTPYKEEVVEGLPIEHFKDYYDKCCKNLEDKQAVIYAGILKLIEKNCRITFVELPFHPKLRKIERSSSVYGKIEEFKESISVLFEDYEYKVVNIPKKRNIYEDLSHLNVLGAKSVSRKLAIRMNKHVKGRTYYYEVR